MLAAILKMENQSAERTSLNHAFQTERQTKRVCLPNFGRTTLCLRFFLQRGSLWDVALWLQGFSPGEVYMWTRSGHGRAALGGFHWYAALSWPPSRKFMFPALPGRARAQQQGLHVRTHAHTHVHTHARTHAQERTHTRKYELTHQGKLQD